MMTSAVSFFIAICSVSCYIFLMAEYTDLTDDEYNALDDFVTNDEMVQERVAATAV